MKNVKALTYIIFLGFLFGSGMVAARFSLGQFDPNTFNSLRLIIVTICFVLIYAMSPQKGWPRDRKLWLKAGLWGVMGLALPMTAFITSLKYLSSGVASLLVTLNAPATLLMAQVFLTDEKLTKRKVIGILIAFAGAALILVRGESGLAEFSRADWRGYALVGVGILGAAGGLIYARRFLQGSDNIDVVAIRMVASLLVIIPFTYLMGGFDVSNVQTSGILVLIFAAVFTTLLTFLLEFYIIDHFGASAASQSSYVIPVVATTLGVLLLGEQVTPTIILGMIAIFIGLRFLN
ncbi:MAG: DMT family transporter [Anaerolineaceae bacterium]|nr:DMT family transporter [Anaerolineaceae bacterium]